jgi:hypothetical protein
LGRLQDAEAARAEEILRQCSSCREQWQQSFEGASQVAAAVADVTESFVPPRRYHRQAWWAAAAAIVFAFSALWFVSPDLTVAPEQTVTMFEVVSDQLPAETDDRLISSLDFESGEGPVESVTEASSEELLFSTDFETGSFDGMVLNRS